MSTLKDKTIAATYEQIVKRADTYVQTGTNIELMNDSGTVQPTGLYLESSAVTDHVGIGTATPGAVFEVEQGASGGVVAFLVDNDDVDEVAVSIEAANTTANVMDITADAATSGHVINITADALTSGSALYIDCDSASSTGRSLVNIIQNNASSSGGVPLRLQQDGTADIMQVFDTSTEVFTILNGGNVGIGAAAPSTTLEVGGSFNTGLVTITATDAITAAEHAGRINLLGEVGGNALVTLTLPDATGTGAVYKFVVSVVNTSNYVFVVPDADNTIDGQVVTLNDDTAGGTASTISWPTAATTDTITLNGTTKGGAAIGDYIELIDIAADQWAVNGLLRASGTEETPFSATIS